ncbi:MAG TPA: hypothetical protein VMS98_14390, partial [Thermoanaerobaculia bacterium]|nr:hypothetical protein [Thermoanaerobaculia bacterium]
MGAPSRSADVIRFANFEVDLQSGEVRKAGFKIKLEGQPFRVLHLLLERPGELITRDEVKRSLWSDKTFVDFDRGINETVK